VLSVNRGKMITTKCCVYLPNFLIFVLPIWLQNLHRTLREMDRELPRETRSINNSRELAQQLNMETKFLRNKHRAAYETLLELIVDYIIRKSEVADKWRTITQVCLGKDRFVVNHKLWLMSIALL
jgi:hypothetical protein